MIYFDIRCSLTSMSPGIVLKALKPVIVHSIFAAILVGVSALAAAQAPSEGLTPGQSLGIYLNITRLPNLRDLGGYSVLDGGEVVRGKVYRTNEFYSMDREDLIKLDQLQLKVDYDLRTPAEIAAQPDTIPNGAQYIRLNVMAGADLITPPSQIDQVLKNPLLATKQLGGAEGVEASFIKLYRDFVSLPSAQVAYRDLFLGLSDLSSLPSVFHCTNGKDRTGWGAAAFLTFLGVSREEVFADYLRSNEYLLPLHQKQIDEFIAGGGDPGIPSAIFGVKKRYLEAAFDEMHRSYGSIEQYFSQGLKIDPKQQDLLRKAHLSNQSR